jgi:hypothetical protein
MKGHRHLLAHLIAGGLIQQDDSGLAWVCASRSGHHFTNEVVAHVRERGFTHRDDDGRRHRYKLVGAARSMLIAAPDTTPRPKRERKKKAAP